MRRTPPRLLLALLALPTLARGADGPAGPAAAPEAITFFETRVRPVLAERCQRCHGPKKQASGLRLDSREALLEGGENGPAVVPGDPDGSLLIQAVRHEGDLHMPPKGKLPEEAIRALGDWVKLGAPWPAEAPPADAASASAETHWAFRPVQAVAPPPVRDAGWVATPIDSFLLAALEGRGLSPSPRADRRTLIRRAAYDLTGLPPTAEEVAAFEADDAPDAFARLVDRLLASPRYGERWGRHWLDVARYADNKGYVFQQERRYPYAYTYRDWVIRAFNEDRPYDRFVVAQVAADALPRGDDTRDLAAMGFLTVGRRFLDNRHDIIDDRIDVVTRGLLGLTVACARCHDHKFDPIPSEDYYALYGVFASSDEPEELPAIVPAEPSPQREDYEATLRERRKEVDDDLARMHEELRRDLKDHLADYLVATLDLGPDPHRDAIDATARSAKLQPERLRWFAGRWRRFLDRTRETHDPALAPWHLLAALPGDHFAARAVEALGCLAVAAGDGGAVDPAVIPPLVEPPPDSMREVARRYGALIASEGPASEALRRLAAAEDGPLTIPPDETRRLFNRKEREHLTALDRKVAALAVEHPGAPPRAMVLVDAPQPREPHVFLRGNPDRPGKEVPRRFLKVLSGPDRPSFRRGSGRLELARAIVSPDNPLTARVMVNRIWQHHFGQGLVRTPSDFGTRSDPPSHPDLLDFLASRFVASGWSVKAMHRLILLSSAYQQRSDDRPEGREADSQNLLLWRQNRRRLDFEAMRDSLLFAAGRLDETRGGRPVSITSAPFSPRRTVYGFIDRQNLPGLFRTFDFASPDASSPGRHTTIVPQQALFLMNSPFVAEQARALALRPEVAAADSPGAQVEALYRRALGRAPEPHEVELATRFLAARDEGEEADARRAALAQVLLLTNEFAYVD